SNRPLPFAIKAAFLPIGIVGIAIACATLIVDLPLTTFDRETLHHRALKTKITTLGPEIEELYRKLVPPDLLQMTDSQLDEEQQRLTERAAKFRSGRPSTDIQKLELRALVARLK